MVLYKVSIVVLPVPKAVWQAVSKIKLAKGLDKSRTKECYESNIYGHHSQHDCLTFKFSTVNLDHATVSRKSGHSTKRGEQILLLDENSLHPP